jgi:hypothetical protein
MHDRAFNLFDRFGTFKSGDPEQAKPRILAITPHGLVDVFLVINCNIDAFHTQMFKRFDAGIHGCAQALG